MMFLTRDELQQLTGYKRSADQIRWLRDRGVHFFVAATGRPSVPRAAIEGRSPGSRAAAEDDFQLGRVT